MKKFAAKSIVVMITLMVIIFVMNIAAAASVMLPDKTNGYYQTTGVEGFNYTNGTYTSKIGETLPTGTYFKVGDKFVVRDGILAFEYDEAANVIFAMDARSFAGKESRKGVLTYKFRYKATEGISFPVKFGDDGSGVWYAPGTFNGGKITYGKGGNQYTLNDSIGWVSPDAEGFVDAEFRVDFKNKILYRKLGSKTFDLNLTDSDIESNDFFRLILRLYSSSGSYYIDNASISYTEGMYEETGLIDFEDGVIPDIFALKYDKSTIEIADETIAGEQRKALKVTHGDGTVSQLNVDIGELDWIGESKKTGTLTYTFDYYSPERSPSFKTGDNVTAISVLADNYFTLGGTYYYDCVAGEWDTATIKFDYDQGKIFAAVNGKTEQSIDMPANMADPFLICFRSSAGTWYIDNFSASYTEKYTGDVFTTGIKINPIREGIHYQVDITAENITENSEEVYDVIIASYKDNVLSSVIYNPDALENNKTKQYDFIIPEGANKANVYLWEGKTLKPIDSENIALASERTIDYNLNTTFCGDPKTMRGFSWDAPFKFEDMVLMYGTSEDSLDNEALATFKVETVANAAQTYKKAFYKTELTNLTPGRTYFYKIFDKNYGYCSPIYSFTTEATDSSEFSIIGITDSHVASQNGLVSSAANINAAVSACPDAKFICNAGDLNDDGSRDDLWDLFFKAFSGVKENLPLVTAVGNHETRISDAFLVDGTANYNLHFNNPQNGAGLAVGNSYTGGNKYTKAILENMDNTVYSFDYGNTHFAVLNSGTDWDNEGMRLVMDLQRDWLRDDLNSSNKKWKVVLIHRGIYGARTRDMGPKEKFLDIIDECGVDLVLQGHDHSYMRSYQMKNDKVVDNNMDYVTQGAGTVYTVLGASGSKRYTPEETLDYMAVNKGISDSETNYSIINFKNDKIEFVVKSTNGDILDQFTINAAE